MGKAEVLKRDQEFQKDGLSACDVALYREGDSLQPLYAALWFQPNGSFQLARQRHVRVYRDMALDWEPVSRGPLAAGLSLDDARSAEQTRDRSQWSGRITQFLSLPDDRIEVSQVRAEAGPEQRFSFSLGSEQAFRERLGHGLSEDDICLDVAPRKGGDVSYLATWSQPNSFASTTLLGLPPGTHREKARELAGRGYLPSSVSVKVTTGGEFATASVWRRIIPDQHNLYPALHRVKAAVALFHLGEAEPMWDMLQHRPDPTERSWLIELLPKLGVPAESLVDRFALEEDVSARRAILLALGGYGRLAGNEAFVKRLLSLVRSDPDPGLRSAAEWLLRRWDLESELLKVEARLPRGLPSFRRPSRLVCE